MNHIRPKRDDGFYDVIEIAFRKKCYCLSHEYNEFIAFVNSTRIIKWEEMEIGRPSQDGMGNEMK